MRKKLNGECDLCDKKALDVEYRELDVEYRDLLDEAIISLEKLEIILIKIIDTEDVNNHAYNLILGCIDIIDNSKQKINGYKKQ